MSDIKSLFYAWKCSHEILILFIFNEFQDRLKFGSASLYLYIGYPKEREKDSTAHNYDYDFFVLELAEHEGVSVDITTPRDTHHIGDLSNRALFQDFVDLMPKLAEANAISDELQRVSVYSDLKCKKYIDSKCFTSLYQVYLRYAKDRLNQYGIFRPVGSIFRW